MQEIRKIRVKTQIPAFIQITQSMLIHKSGYLKISNCQNLLTKAEVNKLKINTAKQK